MTYSSHRFCELDFKRVVGMLATTAALVVVLFSPTSADEAGGTLNDQYLKSHQFGGRIGGWANKGGSPGDSVMVAEPYYYYLTDFQSGNFYGEVFLAYRLSSFLAAEFSLGVVNRGEVVLRDDALMQSQIGNLLMYPILAKVKLYPLGGAAVKFHPYLLAGGGVYYGRHDIQMVSGTGDYFYSVFDEASETTLGWVVGGGVDWPLASVVALDLNAQYMPINFSKALIDVKDYSSLTITVGVKYLFHSSDNNKARHKEGPYEGRN
jgi:outer membrane protein W